MDDDSDGEVTVLRRRARPNGIWGRSERVDTGGAVLLVDGDLPRSLALAAQLQSRGFEARVRAPAAAAGIAVDEQVDLAVLQLGGAGAGDAIGTAQQLLGRDPSIEVIFFAEAECTELAMARGLGIRTILAVEVVADWTLSAAASVARSVRARRALAEASKQIPPLPPLPVRPPWGETSRIPLPVAEQRFREAFLRQLLAETPNREIAARIAGIPYRTLCAMLQKLGLTAASDGRALRRPGSGSGLRQ
jgi:DNA-binding NtrC family response regulator